MGRGKITGFILLMIFVIFLFKNWKFLGIRADGGNFFQGSFFKLVSVIWANVYGFSGRMIRDLDDIEDFKKWLQTKDARAARLEKEKKEKLERTLIEPKHMMDASDHYKGLFSYKNYGFYYFRFLAKE